MHALHSLYHVTRWLSVEIEGLRLYRGTFHMHGKWPPVSWPSHPLAQAFTNANAGEYACLAASAGGVAAERVLLQLRSDLHSRIWPVALFVSAHDGGRSSMTFMGKAYH